jgi:hypothetical protein
MARLIVLPIQDRGDAVVIVTRHTNIELIGFVARNALRAFFSDIPSMCDSMSFVERNLPRIERILLRKSLQEQASEGQIPCVEITAVDLAGIEIKGTAN